MDIIRQLEAEQAAKIEEKRKLPEFQPGDTVRVQVRVTEGTRTRVQAYEGVCIARAEALTIRRSDYIAAIELMGASRLRIILLHVVPLCLPSLFVRLTLDMAGVILIAAGLGFLGLGAQPPSAEWGVMLSSGKEYMLSAWWVATFPGVAIFFVCMGFNLLGDGLRDILDPRQES